MLSQFNHLSTFAAKAGIIVIAILLITGGVSAILGKNKDKSKSKLVIQQINKKYKTLKRLLQKEMVDKKTFKNLVKKDKKNKKSTLACAKNIYVINFVGDLKASALDGLTECVTAILTVATPGDEVLLRLESFGGAMHAYGLAATQLQRIKTAKIPLTVCIDKAAASGGYMMACVASKIIAAPFAIIGSIGVVAQLPNFHRLLKDNHIDFEQITAGQYKRTLTLFGENTQEGRLKFQEEINEAHNLFKDFIAGNRPQLDINKVATGEYWFARRAHELGLVDTLASSDEYLLQASENARLLEISFERKKSLLQKLTLGAYAAVSNLIATHVQHENTRRYL